MSQVDDNKIVRGRVFKTLDLLVSSAVWRALAGVPTRGEYCQKASKKGEYFQRAVKSLRPEARSSLETGAVLDGALSRYLRIDWGARL